MKTVEDRLSQLESRMNYAETALYDLGMRPVHYPLMNAPGEWMHIKEPGLVKLPHPLEGEVFVKSGFLKSYHKEIILLAREEREDPFQTLVMAAYWAFGAWRKMLTYRTVIGQWIPEVVASRNTFGSCQLEACHRWAERKIAEYEEEYLQELEKNGSQDGERKNQENTEVGAG